VSPWMQAASGDGQAVVGLPHGDLAVEGNAAKRTGAAHRWLRAAASPRDIRPTAPKERLAVARSPLVSTARVNRRWLRQPTSIR